MLKIAEKYFSSVIKIRLFLSAQIKNGQNEAWEVEK